ncbi:MAG: RNA-binding protein [Dysgonamonadaceae bacterium]|nr:RNA-binding protein [Dysgonamonadaceae bacterium]MDD4729463.1 RNA-binding protein [Dysgonamonadaceae bacterium]
MNIFIAGLSYQISEPDLKELFEEYGTVSSAKIITDRYSGRSRGFGFVEMDDDAEGQNAIAALNEAEYDGRTLTVSVARPRTERPSGGERRDSY